MSDLKKETNNYCFSKNIEVRNINAFKSLFSFFRQQKN